jgi:MFS family permease
LGGFFYGYVPTLLLGSILAQKFGGKWVMGLGIAAAGFVTILNPVAAIYGDEIGLLIARIIQGIAMVIRPHHAEGLVDPNVREQKNRNWF